MPVYPSRNPFTDDGRAWTHSGPSKPPSAHPRYEENEESDLEMSFIHQQLPDDEANIEELSSNESDMVYEFHQAWVAHDELQSQYEASVEHFDVLGVLGQGSFGTVFMVAKNTGPDKGTRYAMKVLRKATLKVRDRIRTKMERDILSTISHPFIVKLYYAFQTEGKLYLILELVTGGDLFSRLSREVMFTEDDARFYLAELLLAIDHLHQCGIIYRDLKPENVLLGGDGHVKMTDFGLCKEAIFDSKKTYSFCGTVEYMAPEVVSRKGHGPESDWWSFGVLMYEMLTGSLPFHSPNRRDTMNLILNAKLLMPPFISNEAQALLRALFKRVPEHRIGAKQGYIEFVRHPFFQSIHFEKLLNKKIPPPFLPSIYKENSYPMVQVPLNPDFYKKTEPPVIPSEEEGLFKGFSFVAPIANLDATALNDPSEEKAKQQEKLKTKEFFLPLRTTPISADYNFTKVIGQGAFGRVYAAFNKTNGQTYAVKIVDKEKRDPSEEIEILLRYSEYPSIATLRDVYEDTQSFYLIMEYMKGGELLNLINMTRGFSERKAAAYFERIAKAVLYLHDNNVVHRDLQPSNIMFLDPSCNPEFIRLIDFGFSKQIRTEDGLLMTPCYTACFAAPEGYDKACDIWSLGVLLYAMISGTTPYAVTEDHSTTDILNCIASTTLDLESGIWARVTNDAKELIRGMLDMNPLNRLSAKEVHSHKWIVMRNSLPNTFLNCEKRRNSSSIKAIFGALKRDKAPPPKPLLTSINSSSLMKKRNNKKK